MSIKLNDLANDLIDVLSEATILADKLNNEIIKQPPDNLIDLWAALTPQLMETDITLSRLKETIYNAE